MDYLNARPKRAKQASAFIQHVIPHDCFKNGLIKINNIHATFGDHATGLMLLGLTGTGKTTLLKEYKAFIEEDRGIIDADQQAVMPVLSVRCPASSTPKQLLRKVAEKLGAVPNVRATDAQLEAQVKDLLELRGTEIVFFDEFHHLAKSETGKSSSQVANTIKILMDETQIPFVLAGLPHAEAVINEHEELDRRFQQSFEMKVLAHDDPDDLSYCQRLMKSCENNLGGHTISLSSPEMALRFIYASNGCIAYIIEVLQWAITASAGKKIGMKHLAYGYAQCRSHALSTQLNPFSASFEKVLQAAGINL